MAFTQDANGIWRFSGTPASSNGQKHEVNLGVLSAHAARRRVASYFCNSGDGEEATKWASTDGTAGSTAAIADLYATRGGVVEYHGASGLTAPINVTGSRGGITLRGTSAGFMQDAVAGDGADAEGLNRGTKLKWTTASDGIVFGYAAATGTRPTGILIDQLYLDGANVHLPHASPASIYAEAGEAGINGYYSDHAVIQNVNVRGFVHGMRFAAECDSLLIDKVQVVHCVRPIVVNGTNYARIANSIFSHNYWGAYLNSNAGLTVSNCAFVGNCKLAGDATAPEGGSTGYGATGYSLKLSGTLGATIVGCSIVDWSYYNNGDSGNISAVMRNECNSATISGTTFGGPPDKNLMAIFATGNTISGNTKIGTYSEYNIYLPGGSSNNVVNQPGWSVYVAAGANDNVLVLGNDGAFSDNGDRNIINGISKNAGDPDAAGVWNGVTKRDGLVIVDMTNHTAYLYHSGLTGGRKAL